MCIAGMSAIHRWDDVPARSWGDSGSMPHSRIPRFAAILTAAGLLVLSAGVTGCSVVDQLAHKMTTDHHDRFEALPEDLSAAAPWIPSDATDITVVSSTVDDATTIRLSANDDELDTALCAEADRQSAPTMSMDDAPDVYAVDHVLACGAWSVIPTDDGWFGWTPNHPDEEKQSPSED